MSTQLSTWQYSHWTKYHDIIIVDTLLLFAGLYITKHWKDLVTISEEEGVEGDLD